MIKLGDRVYHKLEPAKYAKFIVVRNLGVYDHYKGPPEQAWEVERLSNNTRFPAWASDLEVSE